MDVKNCRMCGRLYNYVGGSYRNLCPSCVSEMEDLFARVKEYIEDNRTAPMNQISKDCGVSIKQLEQWVREERLVFADDSPIGIACEQCGTTIKSGKYCEKCKSELASKFGNMYAAKQEPSKPAFSEKKSSGMRFL